MEPAPACLKDAALGVLEAAEVELGELLQEALGLVEAALQILCGGPQRRGITRRRPGLLGIGQERLAGRDIGSDAVGGQERLGGAGGEGVDLDRLGQACLLGFREGRKLQRDGEGEPACVQASAELGSKAAGQRQPPLDPERLSAQDLGDSGRGERVLLNKAPHDAGLVHGAEGLARAVGLQELGFLEDGRGLFDDHGHLGSPVPSPLGQAFKAVEDFVGILVEASHADRKRRERGGALRAGPTEGLKRRPQAVDRDGKHERRHGRSSTLASR